MVISSSSRARPPLPRRESIVNQNLTDLHVINVTIKYGSFLFDDVIVNVEASVGGASSARLNLPERCTARLVGESWVEAEPPNLSTTANLISTLRVLVFFNLKFKSYGYPRGLLCYLR